MFLRIGQFKVLTIALIFVFGSNLSVSAPSIQSVDNQSGDSLGYGNLELTGVGFGSKSQAAPVLYDFGDYAYENGIYNDHQSSFADSYGIPRSSEDPNTLWVKPSNESTTPTYLTNVNARVAGGPRHYRWNGPNSFLGWPAAYGGLTPPPDIEKLYVSWWYKNDVNQHKYNEFGYVDMQGVFNVGDRVSIAAYPGFSATVLGLGEVNGVPMMGFRVENSGGLNGADWDSQVVKNDISGATLTLDTIISSGGWGLGRGGFSKFLRVWEDSSGSQGIRFSWTQHAIGAGGNTYYDYEVPDDTWVRMEMIMNADSMTGSGYIDNTKITDYVIGGDNNNLAGASPTVALIGFNGKQTFNGADGSEIYIDTTPQRVMLAAEPSWQDVIHWEMQLPIEWTDTRIKFSSWLGTLDSSKQLYLYVADENGDVNQVGFPVSFGKSAALPPPNVNFNVMQ